jgi:hypothetical protein
MHSSVCQSILEVYFLLNRRVWQLEENKGFLKIGESAFGGMIKQYLPYYETTPGDIFAAMYNTARHRFFRGEIEKERFAVWFSRVTRSPDEGAG